MVSSAVVVFCGVLLVGLVWAQAPPAGHEEEGIGAKGCCTAAQWESYIGEMSSISGRRRSMTIGEGMKISYDATGKRVAVGAEIYSRRGKKQVKVIKDYTKGAMYIITKKGCKTIKTKAKFRQSCIPANATSKGVVTMGSPSNQVQENVFELRHGRMGASITVTNDKYCMPVTEFFGGEIIKRGRKKGKHGKGRMIKIHISGALSVFNTTMGIKDKTVFNPPASCKKVDDADDMELTGLSPEAIYMLYRFEEPIENPEEEPVWVKLPNTMGANTRTENFSKKELLMKKLAARRHLKEMNQKNKRA